MIEDAVFLLEQFDLTSRFGGDAMPTAKML